eukprot:3392706-Lingulodinium_polyedra.AAC.1
MGHMPRSSSAVWASRGSPGRMRILVQAAHKLYPSGCCPPSEALPLVSSPGACSLHARHPDTRAFSQTATLPDRGSR